MKRRAMVAIGEEMLTRLLRLPEGQYVYGVSADWRRSSVLIGITGEGLPEVGEAFESPVISPDGYLDLELRAKLEALIKRYDNERDGPDAADLAKMLNDTLLGVFDPRALPSPEGDQGE